MSDKDDRPDTSTITLPYRLRRDGWWLEEDPDIRREVTRVAPKLVLIKGRQQKGEEWCRNPAR